mmetsp:Transcript_100117/g.278958  ORF Transcript_100117/g.278958 Transcript_100117/m.278958 type:complete len:217 (-) Transcript_100117:158-808(-)
MQGNLPQLLRATCVAAALHGGTTLLASLHACLQLVELRPGRPQRLCRLIRRGGQDLHGRVQALMLVMQLTSSHLQGIDALLHCAGLLAGLLHLQLLKGIGVVARHGVALANPRVQTLDCQLRDAACGVGTLGTQVGCRLAELWCLPRALVIHRGAAADWHDPQCHEGVHGLACDAAGGHRAPHVQSAHCLVLAAALCAVHGIGQIGAQVGRKPAKL